MPLLTEKLYRDCQSGRLLAQIFSRVFLTLMPLVLVIFAWLAGSSVCVSQSNQDWRAMPARPYVLRGAERRLLDRAERFLADEQWDDGVAALMRLLESDNFSVVASPVTKGEVNDGQLYISLSEYCHRLLAKLPAQPLARYRILVDATAESWYRRGIAERDVKLLQQVVDQYFCSRWGDDSLMALGEFALQRGEYQAAREAWLRVSGVLESTARMLVYPETDLRLADVRARLVLGAIRARDWRLAELELGQLLDDFPKGRGRLGGREVELGAALAGLLKQARRGREGGGGVGGELKLVELGEEVWSVDLREESQKDVTNAGETIVPVVVNGLVVCQDETSVRAWKLADGEAVFAARGDVFQSPRLPSKLSSRRSSKASWLGRSRYALTANERFVFGVTNALLGMRSQSNRTRVTSTLWSVDLQRDGALALRLLSDGPGVSFVGPPVVKGSQLWVPIASNDQAARAGIACYDLSTGQRRWQRWLCKANTPATGRGLELVNRQLTYDSGIIYANTNLGAIAAVRAQDGQILWLRTYQRESTSSFYRGPRPAIFYQGMLFVLPTDSKQLLALDATTGTEIWHTPIVDASARLIDVTDEHVLLDANGAKALDRLTGKLLLTDEKVPPVGQVVAGDFLIRMESDRLRVFPILNRSAADAAGSQLP